MMTKPLLTESDKLINEQTAADILGVTRQCMSQWRYTGKGPRYVQVSKKCIRYRMKELNEYIESRVMRSTSEAQQKELNQY